VTVYATSLTGTHFQFYTSYVDKKQSNNIRLNALFLVDATTLFKLISSTDSASNMPSYFTSLLT